MAEKMPYENGTTENGRQIHDRKRSTGNGQQNDRQKMDDKMADANKLGMIRGAKKSFLNVLKRRYEAFVNDRKKF